MILKNYGTTKTLDLRFTKYTNMVDYKKMKIWITMKKKIDQNNWSFWTNI